MSGRKTNALRILESLGVPHIVLTNFPSEKGYLVTLGENVDAIVAAAAAQKAGK